MLCTSQQKGVFLCLNKNCILDNSILCSDTLDSCHKNHQYCALVNLLNLQEKTKLNENENIETFTTKLKTITSKLEYILKIIGDTLYEIELAKQISLFLENGYTLSIESKKKISSIINNSNNIQY